MKKQWIIITTIAVISGLWWNLGSLLGALFIHLFRPLILAALVVYLWHNVKDARINGLAMLFIGVAEISSVITYAIQTDPWNVTSDTVTQLVLILSVGVQIGVGLIFVGILNLFLKRINKQSKSTHSITAAGGSE